MQEDDLDRELRVHLEIEAEEQRDRGLSDDEAQHAARRALGSRLKIVEEVYEMSSRAALDALARDARYGLRMLRKHPGFTIVAALTLALGVGANTAMFSVVEAVLLRPLPYPHAEQLVMVWENVTLPAYTNSQNTPAPGNFNDWRRQSTAFTGMAAISFRAWNLTGVSEPARIDGEAVSANLFAILGVDAAFGRTFSDDEDRAGGPAVAVLGYGLWAEHFGADPSILGRTIHLDDVPYQVIGVMPQGFAFPDADDRLWVPIALTPTQLENHGSHFLRVVARRKPGVTLAQAQSELDGIAAKLSREYPRSNTGVGARVMSLREQTVGQVQTPLLMLLGLVGLVLLMVCANVGNLLLARSLARERELAVRAALGAGRGRLLRQLLTESTLLALLGGALALAFASWGVIGLRLLAPRSLPQATGLSINVIVGLFNFGIALAAGLICGIAPAWQTGRADLNDSLKGDARGSFRPSSTRARNVLVVAETALGVVVLVGAGLLLRSFWRLEQVPLGFHADRALTFRVVPPPGRFDTPQKRTTFYRNQLPAPDGFGAQQRRQHRRRPAPHARGGEVRRFPLRHAWLFRDARHFSPAGSRSFVERHAGRPPRHRHQPGDRARVLARSRSTRPTPQIGARRRSIGPVVDCRRRGRERATAGSRPRASSGDLLGRLPGRGDGRHHSRLGRTRERRSGDRRADRPRGRLCHRSHTADRTCADVGSHSLGRDGA